MWDKGFLKEHLQKTLTCNVEDDDDKPDFRELNLSSSGIAMATTSSSSSSSGSVSGKRSDSTSNSGELSVQSCPKAPNIRHRLTRSHSCGSHKLIFTGKGSVNPPTSNVLPTGNICPSGRISKSGKVNNATKTETLGLCSGYYGHGSIIRCSLAGKNSCSAKPPSIRGESEEIKRIGNENYKKGNFAEALRLYDKAISISPGNASYHFNRAAALTGLRRLHEAVKECEEAIKLNPSYVKAHHLLGSLLLSLGQIENARKHIHFPGSQPNLFEVQKLQSVERHLTKCANARRIGDWKSALREVDAIVSYGVKLSPQVCACRAEAYLKLQKLDNAISSMPNELSINRDSHSKVFGINFDAYLLYVTAQIELSMGRFDSALMAIEKAGQIDPRNAEVSILLNTVRLVGRARARGNDLFKSERFTEASSAYGEGLRLDPYNCVLLCNRAACWFKLCQWEKSVDDCNQALRIQPCYIKALLRRAASNSKMEHWSEAVRDYELLRRKLPEDEDVAESLFQCRVALKIHQGEEVYNIKSGGEVEHVSNNEQFQAAIASSCASVVQFATVLNMQCKQMSPFLDTLCTRYPTINFLKVDIDKSPAIAHAENVRIVPTLKIYRKGNRLKEMVCPSTEVLERHYCI